MCVCVWHACGGCSHNANECCIPSVEEGAVEDLKDKGEVLQWEERNWGADWEQQALQGGDEEGEAGGAQVGLLRRLSCRGKKGQELLLKTPVQAEAAAWIYQVLAFSPCACPWWSRSRERTAHRKAEWWRRHWCTDSLRVEEQKIKNNLDLKIKLNGTFNARNRHFLASGIVLYQGGDHFGPACWGWGSGFQWRSNASAALWKTTTGATGRTRTKHSSWNSPLSKWRFTRKLTWGKHIHYSLHLSLSE